MADLENPEIFTLKKNFKDIYEQTEIQQQTFFVDMKTHVT